MNYIWAGLLAIGFLAGILNGRIEEVTNAAFSSAARAVELSIGLLGMMCFWSGMMKIVERSGLINVIAKAAQPILRPLFPGLENNDRAMGAIVMSMSANFMGLGNAATPFGIKAMEELQKLNGKKDTATDAMCMFLVLNSSALQFIPTTVLAIRSDAGSAAPSEVIVCIWAASIFAAIAGILAAKVLMRVWRPRLSAGMKPGRATELKRYSGRPAALKQYGNRPATSRRSDGISAALKQYGNRPATSRRFDDISAALKQYDGLSSLSERYGGMSAMQKEHTGRSATL